MTMHYVASANTTENVQAVLAECGRDVPDSGADR
jgi:hypothetical protein